MRSTLGRFDFDFLDYENVNYSVIFAIVSHNTHVYQPYHLALPFYTNRHVATQSELQRDSQTHNTILENYELLLCFTKRLKLPARFKQTMRVVSLTEEFSWDEPGGGGMHEDEVASMRIALTGRLYNCRKSKQVFVKAHSSPHLCSTRFKEVQQNLIMTATINYINEIEKARVLRNWTSFKFVSLLSICYHSCKSKIYLYTINAGRGPMSISRIPFCFASKYISSTS